jgi:prevent-host-death family protein
MYIIRRFPMLEVSVTTFRKHIPDYLGRVKKGEDISLTARGKVIARLVPPVDESQRAKEQLATLRASCYVGDVVSSLDVTWEADRADS